MLDHAIHILQAWRFNFLHLKRQRFIFSNFYHSSLLFFCSNFCFTAVVQMGLKKNVKKIGWSMVVGNLTLYVSFHLYLNDHTIFIPFEFMFCQFLEWLMDFQFPFLLFLFISFHFCDFLNFLYVTMLLCFVFRSDYCLRPKNVQMGHIRAVTDAVYLLP